MDNEKIVDKTWDEILDSNILIKEGNYIYDIPSSRLIKNENTTLKNGVKFFVISWFVLGILIYFDRSMIEMNALYLYLFFCATIVFVIYYIYYRITIKKKIFSAAERIIINNRSIKIANDSYLISDIKRIYLTKPRQYVYNYYIYVQLENMKKKYWLGTEESNGRYESLCKFVMKNLSGYPSLVKYKNL